MDIEKEEEGRKAREEKKDVFYVATVYVNSGGRVVMQRTEHWAYSLCAYSCICVGRIADCAAF